MDFRFSEEDERFRQEVREFFEKELPPELMAKRAEMETGSHEAWEFGMEFARKLGKKGWLLGAWPKEYGGQGWSYTQQFIYDQERGAHGSPRGDFVGVRLAGPAIMVYGTEEQKKQHLPPIAKCEKIWCQGFSEPEAGSDLPALQTRAVKSGDDYILNGQKVWTTQASHADWGIFLARTNPDVKKREGISYFLLDMKTPGIIVRPVEAIGLGPHFCEVFLDDARVPKDCILGGPEWENRGWQQVIKTFSFERSGVSGTASAAKMLEQFVQFAKETKHNGKPLAEDPVVRHKLAELAIEIEVGRLLSYRILWMENAGIPTAYYPSQGKAFSSELSQRLSNVGVHLLGLYGQLETGSKWVPLSGRIENSYLVSLSNTVGAGTTEIMRNTIAIGLGLPLPPRPKPK